jgi:spore germination cell wall hydrolase CwlJ-like protein
MQKKSLDVLRRSDRVFVAALTVVLVAVSAAVGAAAAYRPHTEQLKTAVVVQPAETASTDVAAEAVPVTAHAGSHRTPAEELVLNKLLAEHRCLSEAMYYEARGEGMKGQKAIAEVIFTRMRTGNFGHSICAVVYEGSNQPHCQFSFTCNGDLAQPKQAHAWMQAQVLAARILTGEERLGGTTGGATNFHAVSVAPVWAFDLTRTTQIGKHIFYKDSNSSRPM